MADGDEGLIKGFWQRSRAYFAETAMRNLPRGTFDEITVGHYAPEGGTFGEFVIDFCRFSERSAANVQIRVFDDAMAVFETLPELRAFVAAGLCSSPEALCIFLKELGFTDRTQETCPDPVIALRRAALAKLTPGDIEALGLDPARLVP